MKFLIAGRYTMCRGTIKSLELTLSVQLVICVTVGRSENLDYMTTQTKRIEDYTSSFQIFAVQVSKIHVFPYNIYGFHFDLIWKLQVVPYRYTFRPAMTKNELNDPQKVENGQKFISENFAPLRTLPD